MSVDGTPTVGLWASSPRGSSSQLASPSRLSGSSGSPRSFHAHSPRSIHSRSNSIAQHQQQAKSKLPRMMSFLYNELSSQRPQLINADMSPMASRAHIRRVIDDGRSSIGISRATNFGPAETSATVIRTELRSPPVADTMMSQFLSDPDCPFRPNTIPQKGPTATSVLKDRRKVTLSLICEASGSGSYRTPPIFALFGSFERSTYFEELKQISQTKEAVPFIKACDTTLRQLLPSLQLFDWVSNPEIKPPPENFFTMPVIAWPLETITKLACYYVTACRVGFTKLVSLIQQGGVFSSGKGLFASLAVATSADLEDFSVNSDAMIRFSIATGLVYQEHADRLERTTESCTRKSFALLVVNVSIACLQQLIAHHNATACEGHVGTCCDTSGCHVEEVIPFSELQITRVVSNRAAVVTGHPVDLIRFEQLLLAFGESTGVKIHRDYLPAPVPENSPFYNQQLKMDLMHSWKDEGLLDLRFDFVMPFFSPVDGQEWSAANLGSTALLSEIAAGIACLPQDLTCSLQLLRPTDALLEFSTGSLRLGQMISWTKRSIVILAEPADTVVFSALPSPRRSTQRHTRAATFAKCAIFNEVLLTANWFGKPRGIGTGDYTAMDCSFFDLGLLLDADKVSGTSNVHFGDHSMTSMPTPEPEAVDPDVVSRRPASGIGTSLFSGSNAQFSSLSSCPSASATGCHLTGVTSAMPVPQLPRSNSRSSESSQGKSNASLQSFVAVDVDRASHQYITIPCNQSNAVFVYQVAPLIRYLEMQNRATLTQGAVEVTRRLSQRSGMDFPAHSFLMCPTVFAFFEYWDTLEFLSKRIAALNARRLSTAANEEERDSEGEESAVAHLALSRAEQRNRKLNQVIMSMYQSDKGIVQHESSVVSPPETSVIGTPLGPSIQT